MRFATVPFLLSLALVLSSAGCSGDSGGKKKPTISINDDDGGADFACVDKDDDGYGPNCPQPYDCDDLDPNVTDECRRCVKPNIDCPCERGTRPVICKPEDKAGDGGVFMCTEGNRYCRDGFWSRCEEAGSYVFVPNAN